MLFSREDDDDDDFFPNPKNKSNLASIFNNSIDNDDSNLSYSAPKQPKAQSKAMVPPASSTSSTITIAKTVQTFKMVDGAYENQGKLGAVVVSTCVDRETNYQLLLYRDKQTHICIAKITRAFKFLIQPKNYASFYDKNSTIWSIHFDSAMDLVDFAMKVALARWKTGDSNTPMMVQDVWCPVNESLDTAEIGDRVEITVEIKGVATEGTEDSFNTTVEVEESGWKQALFGVRPNSQRVIYIQPSMLGDLNPRQIAYNNTVVVKLTVLTVNKEPVKKPDPTTAPPAAEVPSGKARPQPNTTSTESPKVTKADLITRMARMGQALPFKKIAAIPSDSDETEEDLSGRIHNIAPRPRTRLHHATPPVTTSILATQMAGAAGPVMAVTSTIPSPVTIVPHQMTQPYLMGSMYPAPQIDNQAQFNMFFSEVRTTNSELRMGITRLTDKVDAIQSKLENPEKNQPNNEMMSVMERLLQHEQQLKDQLQMVLNSFQTLSSGSKVSAAQAPSTTADPDLQHAVPSTSATMPCQNYTQHEESQERMKKLEEEVEYLKTTTNAQKAVIQNARLADQDQIKCIKELQAQLSEERLRVSTLNESLKSVQDEKDALMEKIDKKNNSLAELQKIILEKQSCIDKLEQAVSECEAKSIDEVRTNLKEVLDQKLIVEEHAKKIFNTVYRLVKVQLKPQTNYSGAFVVSVLADTIKAVTMEYLQNGDLSMSNRRNQTLAEESSRKHKEPVKDDTSTNQVAIEGQYVRKEQRSPVPVDAELSTMFVAEESSESEASTTKDPSVPSPRPELSVIVNNSDRFRPEESSSDILIGKESEEGKIESKTSLHIVASDEDLTDVYRPQPPPPPLFDDEQNSDVW